LRLRPRRIDHGRDVASDDTPLRRVLEHCVRDPVQVKPGAVGEPVLCHRRIYRLQIRSAELLNWHRPDAGAEMLTQ
jgi:hypothetical protein